MSYRGRVTVFLCSLATLTYLDRICISLVSGRVKADLGLNNEQFGWVLAAFSLAYAVFEIPSGAWGDRIGPRVVFIRIVLLWSLFTALTGLVTGLVSLVIVRFLFGVGESGTYPNIMLAASRWFPLKEMGRALIWVGMGSQIGSAIAPQIIVPIAQEFGWRTPFFVIAGIGVIWVLVCYSWFRDLPNQMKGITPHELSEIESNRRYAQGQHLIPLRFIIKNPTLWGLMMMYFCCQWSNYFFVAWLPVYLQDGRQFSEVEMKSATTVLFLAGIAGCLAGGYVCDALVKWKGLVFGRRFVGLTGLGLCGLLMIMAAQTNGHAMTTTLLSASNFCFSYGVMVSYAACTDIGRNNAGTVTGAMNFFGQMGAFTLSLVFGKMVQAMNNFNYPLILVGVVLVAGGLLWLSINPSRRIGDADLSSSSLP